MSKSRNINTKIRISQSFSRLTYRQRDLWHGIIVAADDQGRLPGHPAAVRSLIWPYDDIGINEIIADIKALEKTEKILLYSSDDADYIQIIKWWKYQKMQWAGEFNFPPPDGWLDRKRYHSKGRKIVTENWDTPGGFVLIVQEDEVNDKDKVNDNDNVNARQQSNTTKVVDKGSQNVFQYYENNIGALTPVIGELLEDSEKELGAEWVKDAIEEAVKNNVRKWAYIEAILNNWITNGRGAKKNGSDKAAIAGSWG